MWWITLQSYLRRRKPVQLQFWWNWGISFLRLLPQLPVGVCAAIGPPFAGKILNGRRMGHRLNGSVTGATLDALKFKAIQNNIVHVNSTIVWN